MVVSPLQSLHMNYMALIPAANPVYDLLVSHALNTQLTVPTNVMTQEDSAALSATRWKASPRLGDIHPRARGALMGHLNVLQEQRLKI